ncbi:hypothetical protein D3C86_1234130 [compost metagenome]
MEGRRRRDVEGAQRQIAGVRLGIGGGVVDAQTALEVPRDDVVVELAGGAATQAQTGAGRGVAHQGHVRDGRGRARQDVEAQLVIVGLVTGVAGGLQRVLGDDHVLDLAVPAEGPVQAVVVCARQHQVLGVDRAAEELDRIVAAVVGLDIVDGRTRSDAPEGDGVQFVGLGEAHAGIFDADILQRARGVVRHVAAVQARAAFGFGFTDSRRGRAVVDDAAAEQRQAAPLARIGVVADAGGQRRTGVGQTQGRGVAERVGAGQDDGLGGGALSVDARAALDGQLRGARAGVDLDARIDRQDGGDAAGLLAVEADVLADLDRAVQLIGRAGRQGQVGGDLARDAAVLLGADSDLGHIGVGRAGAVRAAAAVAAAVVAAARAGVAAGIAGVLKFRGAVAAAGGQGQGARGDRKQGFRLESGHRLHRV